MNYTLMNGMKISGPLNKREKAAILGYVVGYYDDHRYDKNNSTDLAWDRRIIARIPEVA